MTKELVPGQFVPQSLLADKLITEPETAPAPKKIEVAKAPEAPKPTPRKKVYHDVTVQTTTGTIRHRYEKLASGELVYIGVVRDLTSEAEEELRKQVQDAREESKRQGDAKSAPESKPDAGRPRSGGTEL